MLSRRHVLPLPLVCAMVAGCAVAADVLGSGGGDVWSPVAPDGKAVDGAEDRGAAGAGY